MTREMQWNDYTDEPCCFCGEYTVVLADKRRPVNKLNGFKRQVRFRCKSCNAYQMRLL